MARVYREVQSTKVRNINDGHIEDPPVITNGVQASKLQQIIYLVGGTVIAFLFLRLLLVLLGANPNNAFASFIYSVGGFFASPFFGLFNYRAQLGVVRFEFETLVAIVVYWILIWFFSRVVFINES